MTADANQGDRDGTPNPSDSASAGEWLSLIERARKDSKEYHDSCDKIRKRYRYESSASVKTRKYQLLYANIETLKPAVYGRLPKPVVETRNKTGNPVARIAAMLLERTLSFMADTCDYNATFEAVRDDYLLYARGVPRLRYEAIFNEDSIEDGLDDGEQEAAAAAPPISMPGDPQEGPAEPGEDGEPEEPAPTLSFENVKCDFVQREDFIHPPARTWKELPWIAYRAYLTKAELIKRWPKIGATIPLDARPGSSDDRDRSQVNSVQDKATIYEVWDKTRKCVLWVAQGYPDILEESEPYLKLTGFFPSPKPAYGVMTTDSLIPRPDFVFYQDQAEEIDELTARIASLQDSLKLVGFYPAGPSGEGSPEIEKAVKPGFENRMVAVKSWAAFTAGGQGSAPIVWLPMEQVIKVLEGCVTLRKELMDDVYQITGLSDIMRGDTDPDETAAAQGMKQANGGKRIKTRQNEISRVCAEVMQMAGEIIAEQFDIKTLMEIAEISLPSDADVMAMQQAYEQAMVQYQGIVQSAHSAAAQAGLPPPAPPGAPHPPGPSAPAGPPGAPPQQMGAPPAPMPPGGPPQGPQGAPMPQGPQLPPPPPKPQDLGPTQEQVMAVLRSNVLRRFRLDIETDSTIAMDEAGEQMRRTAFITATTQFMEAWGPMVQGNPKLAPLAGDLLIFGLRGFPTARELETSITKMVDDMVAQAQQPKPPPPIAPVDQAKIQVANITAQAKLALGQQQMRNDAERHQAEMQQLAAQGSIEQTRAQAELERVRMEAFNAQQSHEHDMASKVLDMQARRQEALNNRRQLAISPEAEAGTGPIGAPDNVDLAPAHPSGPVGIPDSMQPVPHVIVPVDSPPVDSPPVQILPR